MLLFCYYIVIQLRLGLWVRVSVRPSCTYVRDYVHGKSPDNLELLFTPQNSVSDSNYQSAILEPSLEGSSTVCSMLWRSKIVQKCCIFCTQSFTENTQYSLNSEKK